MVTKILAIVHILLIHIFNPFSPIVDTLFRRKYDSLKASITAVISFNLFIIFFQNLYITGQNHQICINAVFYALHLQHLSLKLLLILFSLLMHSTIDRTFWKFHYPCQNASYRHHPIYPKIKMHPLKNL